VSSFLVGPSRFVNRVRYRPSSFLGLKTAPFAQVLGWKVMAPGFASLIHQIIGVDNSAR
jgi:hypothetical protein